MGEMSRPQHRAPCASCREPSSKLRRGLCSRCYQRKRRGSPAAAPDAACLVCRMSDARMLRAVKLGGELVVACHSHAWLAERARPQPTTPAELLALCVTPGDRRAPSDRRARDRRTGARRNPGPYSDRRELGPRAGVGDRRVLEDRRARG